MPWRTIGRVPAQLLLVATDPPARSSRHTPSGPTPARTPRRDPHRRADRSASGYAVADVLPRDGRLRAARDGVPPAGHRPGEQGFGSADAGLRPGSCGRLVRVGGGSEHGRPKLEALLGDCWSRDVAPSWAATPRDLVVERFALEAAAGAQLKAYPMPWRAHRSARDSGSCPPGHRRQRLWPTRSADRLEGVLGKSSLDDFNSRPVAARPSAGR